ncbi:MAG: DUF4294 domain-containing protein [Rikenellaceae bacterium]
MKRWILLTLLLMAISPELMSQERTPKGHWHQEWIVEDGERIPHIHILPVYVFNKGLDKRKYWRLVDAVKKTYPLAQTAKDMMADMEDELASLKTKKEQKAYVKEVYNAIIDEYTPVLKKMNRTQGRVLLRLIDRETEYTAYNIVHEFRGGFIAGFWQGVSKIFGQDLKAEYGENKEDDIIEQIVLYYEAGLL